MRSLSVAIFAMAIAGHAVHGQASPRSIRHVVIAVAATNDEWTTTGLTIGAGDLMIVRAPGYVIIGDRAGERDAAGNARNGVNAGPNGSLEYKVGVGAGKPGGKFDVHVVEESGELKFRIRDTDYHDNKGQFFVDVVILPPSAIPPAHGGGDASEDAGADAMTVMKAFLRRFVTDEEAFFANNSRYTNRVADLAMVKMPEGVTLHSLSVQPALGGGSWTAVVVSSHMPTIQCGVSINMRNPVDPTSPEGAPACR